jgi:hypothetical protein
MSIEAHFLRIPPYELDDLLEAQAEEDDPDAVWSYIASVREKNGPAHGSSFRLGGEWELLQALLSGRVWSAAPPLGNAITGGRPLLADHVRYLYSADVSAVADALSRIDEHKLFAGANKEMLEREDIDTSLLDDEFNVDQFGGSLAALKQFYRLASASGDAVLLWLA